MFREAVGHLSEMAGSGRVEAFRNFAGQISESSKGAWQATQMAAQNVTMFVGEAGEALVFDAAGQMFRGNIANTAAFVLQKGGEYIVNLDKLRAIP